MFDEKAKLCLRAAAKINLYLEVRGVRENGYHDIRSIMVPIGLHDDLTLETTRRPEIEMTVDLGEGGRCEVMGWGDDGLAAGSNLAARAATALKQATEYPGGASIALKKNVPVGGGLGGGSADAAATLMGLNELWGTGLSRQELMAVGASLGCDVPALIHGGAVSMQGVGEEVTALQAEADGEGKGWHVVILNPGFRISTADIYSRCTCPLTSDDGEFMSMVSALRSGDVDLAGMSLFNGLQETVFRKYPLVRLLAESLENAGAIGALVSGSGASVFGLASDEAHAESVVKRVRESLQVSVWSWITRTLPDGVTAAHGPLEARV